MLFIQNFQNVFICYTPFFLLTIQSHSASTYHLILFCLLQGEVEFWERPGNLRNKETIARSDISKDDTMIHCTFSETLPQFSTSNFTKPCFKPANLFRSRPEMRLFFEFFVFCYKKIRQYNHILI